MEELKEGWKRIKLEKLGEIISGGTPKTSIDKYWNGDIIWLTPKDFSNEKIKYWSVGERNITEEGLKNSSAKLMPKGTVLFTSRAPIGYVGIANTEVSTNQGFKNIIVNKENSNEFVYYLLKYITPHIESIAGGSTFKEISASIFRNIEVEVPNLEIQEKIASILSTLDDKIEINNEMNKTLEEMAQTLFKRWFIDFDFPNESGEPYKSSGGKMVDSELGEIPEGWTVNTLKEACKLLAGGDKPKKFSKTKDENYNIPIFSNAIENDGIYGFTDKAKIFEKSVTISARGTIGFICLRNTPYVPIVRLISAIPKINNLSTEYLYYWLKVMRIHSTGTTQQQLTIPQFKEAKILLPKVNLMLNFTKKVKSFINLLEKNKIENNNLLLISNTLLPKLMNGEVEV